MYLTSKTERANVGLLEFNVQFQHKYGYIRDKLVCWRRRTVLGLPCSRLKLYVADCGNVYQTLEGLLVLLPGLAHLKTFILCYTNLFIMTIIIIFTTIMQKLSTTYVADVECVGVVVGSKACRS